MDKTKAKLESLIQENLSIILSEELDNPELEDVNIVAVKLNGDNSVAIVYVSWFGKVNKLNEIKSAGSYLRQMLSKRLTLKGVPYLEFEEDTLLDEINELENTLKGIK